MTNSPLYQTTPACTSGYHQAPAFHISMNWEVGGLVFVFPWPVTQSLRVWETQWEKLRQFMGPRTRNSTNLNFTPFLNKGTATTHEMRKEVVKCASLRDEVDDVKLWQLVSKCREIDIKTMSKKLSLFLTQKWF